MTKRNINLIAKVLKEVAEKYCLKGLNLQNGWFALANDYDLVATFYVYKKASGEYSFLYIDINNSSLYKINKVYNCLLSLENKLNEEKQEDAK